MNIKTNLFEEHVNFVDIKKKQNKNLWMCTNKLVFILIILTLRRAVILSKKLCDTFNYKSIYT